MIRTQIRLIDHQMRQLKKLVRLRRVSVTALVREGAEWVIRGGGAAGEDAKRRRAMSVAGKFRSGQGDLALNHDRHLAEALEE